MEGFVLGMRCSTSTNDGAANNPFLATAYSRAERGARSICSTGILPVSGMWEVNSGK